MIFSSKISKFGKGSNLSAYINTLGQISIFYFLDGVSEKIVNINEDNITLSKTNTLLPYNEVIQINENYLVSRIDKSLGIIKHEK